MHEQDVPADPLELFAEWLGDARDQTLHSGVTLATVGSDGQPSARVVLLRGHDERGFEHGLHDRLRYRRSSDGWVLERLAP